MSEFGWACKKRTPEDLENLVPYPPLRLSSTERSGAWQFYLAIVKGYKMSEKSGKAVKVEGMYQKP
jgi:hypothetical protein